MRGSFLVASSAVSGLDASHLTVADIKYMPAANRCQRENLTVVETRCIDGG